MNYFFHSRSLQFSAVNNAVYQIFLVVSPSPPQTYYIYMRVTNKVGQRIIVHSGDDMPTEGFPVSANVIAEITKTVPGNIQTTFTVYNVETGKPMAINQSKIITITPTPTKQYPYNIVITKIHLFQKTLSVGDLESVTERNCGRLEKHLFQV